MTAPEDHFPPEDCAGYVAPPPADWRCGDCRNHVAEEWRVFGTCYRCAAQKSINRRETKIIGLEKALVEEIDARISAQRARKEVIEGIELLEALIEGRPLLREVRERWEADSRISIGGIARRVLAILSSLPYGPAERRT